MADGVIVHCTALQKMKRACQAIARNDSQLDEDWLSGEIDIFLANVAIDKVNVRKHLLLLQGALLHKPRRQLRA